MSAPDDGIDKDTAMALSVFWVLVGYATGLLASGAFALAVYFFNGG